MFCNLEMIGGRDSTVSIVTAYELSGPGIEFQWGQDFLHMSRPAWGGAHPASYTMVTRSFPEVKWPGCGDHPLPSSAKF